MWCILWVIVQSLAVLVDGGVSSASAEAIAKAAGKNIGGAAGNNANAGAQNGLPLNGQAIVAQLVPLGGSIFLQQAGNQAGQAPLQQLIPFGAVQQGGALIAGQAGGGGVGQPAQGGPIMVYAVLPQGGAIGNAQNALLNPGRVQLLSAVNNQPQPALGPALGPAPVAGGRAGAILRFQRSAATRPRATQATGAKVMASEEEEEEEEEDEEGSGMDTQQKQQ